MVEHLPRDDEVEGSDPAEFASSILRDFFIIIYQVPQGSLFP